MKKTIWLFPLLPMIALAGCCKDNGPIAPVLEIEAAEYRIGFLEGSQLAVTFDVNVDWTASVEHEPGDEMWLSVGPESGAAGNAELLLTAAANYGASPRIAYVDIMYGQPEAYRITVTQSGRTDDVDITTAFDPLFADELQKRGYVEDAGHITFGEVMNIRSLDVSVDGFDNRGSLTSLRGIEYFGSLNSLSCSRNLIRELDLSMNAGLEYLSCSVNCLTELDLSENLNLDQLYCSENEISSLNLGDNRRLTILSCNNNQLESLDLSNDSGLKWLTCGYNNISRLDLGENPDLLILTCEYNRLSRLDLSGNTVLKKLNCSFNDLKVLDLANNPELQVFQSIFNDLICLDISRNKALTFFDCAYNPGTGGVFVVTSWFDNGNIPEDFTTGLWSYDEGQVKIDYQLAE